MNGVVTSLLEMLRADVSVQAVFGVPARVFAGETERPAYPYAELIGAELREIESAQTPRGEHRITFAVNVRDGGRDQAEAGLGVLMQALQENSLSLPGMSIVLAHPVYLDIVRGREPQSLRGLLRLRIITEEEPGE